MSKTDHEKRCETGGFLGAFTGRAMGNNSRSGTKMTVTTLSTTSILVFTALLAIPSTTRADNGDDSVTFTLDVSQIAVTKGQNDVNPSEGDQTFSRGDTVILGGTIYPGHTLPKGAANNDPNIPGIGKYEMRGTYTGKPELPIVAFATELFSLSGDTSAILTDGLWPNEGFSTQRVVLGGTGRFRYSVGEVSEENLGRNKEGFCNLRVTFRLRIASGQGGH